MLSDAERDEIAKALRRMSAAEVARELIFPLNDVLTVQQELAGDRPAPNRTHALQPPVPMVVRPCPPDPDFTPAAVPAPRESTTVTETTTTRPSWPPPQIAQLLDKASAIVVQGDAPRIEAARQAVYGALDVLRDVVDRHARTSGARERLAELEAEAARLRELLEGDDDPPTAVAEPAAATAAPVSVRPAVDSATIRAWARVAGVDVPPKGPLGARWVDAYWAAQGPQAAAS